MHRNVFRSRTALVTVAVMGLAWFGASLAQASDYSDLVTADTPIAWYRMDDTTDETGNHDGSTLSGVTFDQATPIAGDSGMAAGFDGSGEITVPHHADFDFGTIGDFTIEFWAKRGEVTSDRYCVLNKGDSDNAYWMRFNPDGSMRFTLDYGSQGDNVTSATYADSQWHHYVGVADRDSSVKLYVDGQLAGEDLEIQGTGSVDSTGIAATIGYLPAGSHNPETHLLGSLDEVAVYNTVLSSTQIDAHYNSGLSGTGGAYDTIVGGDSPIGWWRMADETDSGSGGHTCTISDLGGVTFQQPTVIYGDQPPPHLDNGTGSAAFDGSTESYIIVDDAPDLNFGRDTDFAIEAWINVESGLEGLTESAMIFNKGDTDGGCWMRLEKDGTARFMLDFGSAALDVQDTTSIADGFWHHVVGVADRDVGLELYVDNMLVDSASLFDGNDVSSTLDLQIGMLGTGSALLGSLDELAIYDYTLSEADILAHYQAGVAAEEVPGDTNADGDVDADDLAVVAGNWGDGVTPGDVSAGDFNNDGVVDVLDAAIQAANWTGPGESNAAVPEPSVMAGLLSIALALAACRRKVRFA